MEHDDCESCNGVLDLWWFGLCVNVKILTAWRLFFTRLGLAQLDATLVVHVEEHVNGIITTHVA